MRSDEPTEGQIFFLKNRDIVPPLTRRTCSALIDFIKRGNITIGATESARLALAKAAQARWLGKRVRDKGHVCQGDDCRARHGIVRQLVARRRNTMIMFRESDRLEGLSRQGYSPFQLSVRWDDGRTRICSISGLEF